MFLNFGRFFGFGQQPKLDNLLKNQNLTIETILNEEEILSELKGQSASKFADFLIQHPEEYKKMIGYIVDEIPEQCADKNRCIKYPFLISEILGAENEKLINFLFEKPEEPVPEEEIKNPLEDQETEQIEQQHDQNTGQENEVLRANLLNDLLQLLESDAIIITTAGYFSKIVAAIIHRRGYSFWEHLKHNPELLSNLFKHSYLKHIVYIFEKLISLEAGYEQLNEYIAERKALFERLLAYLKGKKHSPIIVENICEIIIELYKKAISSMEQQNHVLRDILVEYTITDSPHFFMNLAIHTQQSVVYGVLNAQFEFVNKLSEHQFDFSKLYSPILGQTVKALEQVDYLKLSFVSADGIEISPIGEGKLLLLQLLVQLSRREEIELYFTSEIFQQIIDLVKQYPANNQLHLLFEKLITSVFESKSEHLHVQLFEETNLLLFLVQQNNEQARQNKFGYQGSLTRISNYLQSNSQSSDSIKRCIQTMHAIDVDWDLYMQALAPVNKREQEWILGINPKQKDFHNDDESQSPQLQMPEPLVQYAYNQGPTSIRKCESSDNNDVVKPRDDQEEVAEIEEDIEDESEEHILVTQEGKQNQNQFPVEQVDNLLNTEVKEEYIETKELIDPQEEEQLQQEPELVVNQGEAHLSNEQSVEQKEGQGEENEDKPDQELKDEEKFENKQCHEKQQQDKNEEQIQIEDEEQNEEENIDQFEEEVIQTQDASEVVNEEEQLIVQQSNEQPEEKQQSEEKQPSEQTQPNEKEQN